MTSTDPFSDPSLVGRNVDETAMANSIGSLLQSLTRTSRTAGQVGPLQPDPAPSSSQSPMTIPQTQTTPGETPTTPDTSTTSSSDSADPVPQGTPVTSPFGPRGGGFHAGVDLGVTVGTTIVSAISGTVSHASNTDPNGYGNMVEVQGSNGISTRYGHLSYIGVNVGDKVKAGQPIGKSGGAAGAAGSGDSTGPHLHFEVELNGKPIDPMSYLAGGAQIIKTPKTPSITTNSPDRTITPQDAADTAANRVLGSLTGEDPGSENQVNMVSKTTPGKPAEAAKAAAGQATDSGNFAKDILNGIGAPITPENLRVIQAWMRAEGGAGHNNPLNTTQGAPGATNFNSVGVKVYTSYEQGVQATIQTLLNGYYGNIIAALRAGTSASSVADAIAASPWGTGALVQRIIAGG